MFYQARMTDAELQNMTAAFERSQQPSFRRGFSARGSTTVVFNEPNTKETPYGSVNEQAATEDDDANFWDEADALMIEC